MMFNMIKKYLSFSFGSFISIILSVIITPMTTWFISPEEFGKTSIYILTYNLIILFSVIGLDQAFVKYYYKTIESDRDSLFVEIFRIPIFLSVIFGIIQLLFWKKISKELISDEKFLLVFLLVINIVVGVFEIAFTLYIRMKQRGVIFSVITIVSKLFSIIALILYAVFINKSYEAIIVSQIIASLMSVMICLYYEGKVLFCDFKKVKKNVTKKFNVEYLIYAIPFIPAFIVDWLFQSSDKIAIKYLLNLNDLGIYFIAFKFVAIIKIFQNTFSIFWAPIAFEKYEKYGDESILFFRKAFRVISLLLILLGFIIIVFRNIIVLIISPEYKETLFIMPMLIFMPIMYTISEVTVVGINFKSKTKYHFYISLIVSLVNIILNILFIKTFGIRGAAMGLGTSYIVFFYLRTYFSELNFRVKYNLKEFSLYLILLYSFALMATFITSKIYIINFIGVLIIIILLLYLCKTEKKKIYNRFKDIIRKK